MAEITALRVGRGRGKRVNVFLDSRFAFSLESETVAREDLRVGQELSPGRVEELTRTDQYNRCLNAAYNCLSYRARSEYEVRERLRRRGFAPDCIESVLAKLREQNLIDDAAFARFWKESREAFSPRSHRLTRMELRQKGVPGNIIEQVVEGVDDEDNAYRAALSKTRRWPRSDYREFRRRLGGYLRRRGFDYEALNRTVERVWREGENGSR